MPVIEPNLPVAENFMETARSFGNYDLAFALADIIDNSITAGATIIRIEANFDEGEIRVSDNGTGMSRDELKTAMRVGSKNPKDERSDTDLGRFGLGLKTASFSQADRLLVLTHKDGEYSGAEWDLNDCANFGMKRYDSSETIELIKSPIATENGTEVVWKELTRLLRGSAKDDEEKDFNAAVTNAVDEIGLIFHRFLEADEVSGVASSIQIFFNNRMVEPIDPFCRSNGKLQRLSPNSETVGKEVIRFTPFTLPLFKELKPIEKKQLGGNEGFIKNAGFYIYRNRRLIIRGTWFKLVPYGELSKLSRIMVDIPNSLDQEWKITVDKSGVQLPGLLRRRLSNWLQSRIVPSSVRVFEGHAAGERIGEAMWTYSTRQGVGRFTVNKTHPVLTDLMAKFEKSQAKDFNEFISMLEHLLPIEFIRNMVSDQPDIVYQGYSDTAPKYVLEKARVLASQMLDRGKTKTDILSHLAVIQPFNQFKDEVNKHFDEIGLFRG